MRRICHPQMYIRLKPESGLFSLLYQLAPNQGHKVQQANGLYEMQEMICKKEHYTEMGLR